MSESIVTSLRTNRSVVILYTYLRCQKRRHQYDDSLKRSQQDQIKDRVSMDAHLAVVDKRSRIGDWQADTVVGAYQGSQRVLATLTEHKTRYPRMIKTTNKTAIAVQDKLLEIIRPLVEFVKMMTDDNSKEFALHGLISASLKAVGYFAHPYHL